MDKLFKMAARSDAALNKRVGYQADDVTRSLHELFEFGRVEVGYRQSCGVTDPTHFIYREWVKLMKAAKKMGLGIEVEAVKHKNYWSTLAGGFWHSDIYTLHPGRTGI
jgi:hypothetical protein